MFSLGIIAENFKVFENDIFDCKVLWLVGKCEWILSVSSFCEVCSAASRSISWARCLPVVLAFAAKVGFFTAKAAQSEKLR